MEELPTVGPPVMMNGAAPAKGDWGKTVKALPRFKDNKMSTGPFNLNRPFDRLKTQQPKPVSPRQKRETYRRLFLLCEVYGTDRWRLALERARRRTGVMK